MKKFIMCLSLCTLILGGCTIKTENNIENDKGTINNNEIIKQDIIKNDIEKEDSGDIVKDKEESGEKEALTEEIKTEIVEVVTTNLSNKTNAWGFVRKKDGVQPEFANQYTKVLDAYEGIYVGNKDEKKIYLTFDEGYENGYTDDILDTLKEKNVTAVFFVTMPYVKQNKELVQRMVDEGHIVGNHISRTSMYHIKIS